MRLQLESQGNSIQLLFSFAIVSFLSFVVYSLFELSDYSYGNDKRNSGARLL